MTATKLNPTLVQDCYYPSISEKCDRDESVSTFASTGDDLLVGTSQGRIFRHKDGMWNKVPLKCKDGINQIFPDGESVIVGDGRCCSGATYQLFKDDTYELIRPVDKQNDDQHPFFYENIRCNVYGFARHGSELLVGGGGCAGKHIYHLNESGQWKYHPNDPKQAVMAMKTASDGNVYIAMYDENLGSNVYRYDGKCFMKVGHFEGYAEDIIQYRNIVYIASHHIGGQYPGYIVYVALRTMNVFASIMDRGMHGFFVYKDELYAYGITSVFQRNAFTHQTILLREKGGWEMVARFDKPLKFTVHNGEVYAGYHILPSDVYNQPYQRSRPPVVIYKVLMNN